MTYYEEGEHACEGLVRIIQSREGNPSQTERESAFAELLEMFRPLILKIASSVFKDWKTYIRDDFATFYHDTITTAIELIYTDYIPKKYGGKAMFAPYLQRKLYFRTLYRAQRAHRLYSRELVLLTSIDNYESNRNDDAIWDQCGENEVVIEVKQAILDEISHRQTSATAQVSNLELNRRIVNLSKIAKASLTPTEFSIWHGTIFTELQGREIAANLNQHLANGERPWTKQRIHNAYHKIRTKVMAAYGEAILSGKV